MGSLFFELEPLHLALRHFHHRESLLGGNHQLVVRLPTNLEFAPEPRAAHISQLATDLQPVAELCRAAVIDLSAREDGIYHTFGHPNEIHSQGCGQPGSAGFDHSQVGEIVHHASAICIEKHYFLPCDHRFSGSITLRIHASSFATNPRPLQCSLACIHKNGTVNVFKMFHFFRNFLRSLAFLAFAAGAHAAPFVAPTEGNPPFRRDLLPIDTDSMVTLSNDLAVLSHGIPLKTAAERRAAAQSLALALALDPANSEARDKISELAKGKNLRPEKSERLTQAKTRLWQVHAWLDSPEAGADGKLLGEMMGDAASVLDPENSVATVLRSNPEKGQWDEWVAPLSAFKKYAVAKNAPDNPPTAKLAIVLKAGSLTSVLYVYDKVSRSWDLRPTSVEMKATTKRTRTFEVAVAGPPGEQQKIKFLVSNPIRKALQKNHMGLPKNGLISITTNKGGTYSTIKNGSKITGPGFILANSAITGVEIEATVLASLNDENELVAPDFFWRQVKALKKGKGGRLVVPAGTEEYFTAMLTLEEPSFLLKYEVLVASSPKEFMELCAKVPSEKQAAAFARFQEIKAKAEDNLLGSYLSNSFVRQRLQEIVDAAPYHLSARLLAQQGGGKRPRTLSKKILASEIWCAVAPIKTLRKPNARMMGGASVKKTKKIYETMRAELNRLDSYTSMRDRDLLSEGKDAAIAVRKYSRAFDMRTDNFREKFARITSAHKEMIDTNDDLLEKLSELSGDPYK